MKFFKSIITLSASFLIAFSSLSAQENATVATNPVGYVELSIGGGSVENPQWSFVSLPLQAATTNVDDSVGVFSNVSSSSFQNSTANWDENVFSSSLPHYIRITSGSGIGIILKITSNTSTEVFVDNKGVSLLDAGVIIGDSYEIFPGDTLLTAFGDDSNGIIGGTSPTNVDTVYILDSGAWGAYYYNTTNAQWRKGALPFSQNDLPIAPDTSIIFSRVGSSDLKYVFTGRVPVTKLNVAVAPLGFTSISSYFPVAQTLSDIDVETLSWWKSVGDAGVTQNNADKIYLYESGAWAGYHYDTSISQWRKGALPFNQNNVQIDLSAGILVGRTLGSQTDQIEIEVPY